MTAKHIDPIAVKEERERQTRLAQTMQEGAKAADALLWFQEYAKPTEKAADVMQLSVKAVASSTPNAQHAETYMRRALAEHAELILERAVELAQATHSMAEAARKRAS